MVEKLNGYRVGDQIYPTLIEATKAEGLQELIEFFNQIHIEGSEFDVPTVVDYIHAKPVRFMALLSKAGIRVRERKAKPPAEPGTAKPGRKRKAAEGAAASEPADA